MSHRNIRKVILTLIPVSMILSGCGQGPGGQGGGGQGGGGRVMGAMRNAAQTAGRALTGGRDANFGEMFRDLKDTQGQLATAQGRVKTLEGELAAARAAGDTSSARVKSLEAELKTANENLASTNQQLATTKDALTESQSQFEKLEESSAGAFSFRDAVTGVNQDRAKLENMVGGPEGVIGTNQVSGDMERIGLDGTRSTIERASNTSPGTTGEPTTQPEQEAGSEDLEA